MTSEQSVRSTYPFEVIRNTETATVETKLYEWNLWALGITLGAWLLTRLIFLSMPMASGDAPLWIGVGVCSLAYPILGRAVLQAVQLAKKGTVSWGQSLLLIGVTLLQSATTLFLFVLLLAEGYGV